jgi:outer membrane protein OmpA-like peptidoglycan-associated protein
LSGDLDEPFAMMKFKRCMGPDPATAIRQNAGLPTSGGTNSGNGGVALYAPGQLYTPGSQPLYRSGQALVSPGKALVGPGQALVKPGKALLVQETPQGIVLRLAGDLLFDFDKFDLRPEAVATMREVATKIRAANPRGKIRIAGYTDSKGSQPFNMRLSQQRASSVETWLVQNAGFPASAFSRAGYGAANPVAPNETPDGHDDPDGRQRNRRVEIVIPK